MLISLPLSGTHKPSLSSWFVRTYVVRGHKINKEQSGDPASLKCVPSQVPISGNFSPSDAQARAQVLCIQNADDSHLYKNLTR